MQQFPEKEKSPNFFDPNLDQSYILETGDSKALLQKELDVNQAEQNLLFKRIDLMKSFINELPSSDPQYSMLLVQLQMDQIEIDELKQREALLIERLEI